METSSYFRDFSFARPQTQQQQQQSDLGSSIVTISVPNLLDHDYGVFAWPSSECLARVLWHCPQLVRNLRVLELGAGTCLPGLVSAACGAKEVIFTDRHNAPEVMINANRAIDLNKHKFQQDISARVVPLTWGVFDFNTIQTAKSGIDTILAADCFYESGDFDDILASVSLFFSYNPQCVFVVTYHCRSGNHTIQHLLEETNLKVLCVVNMDNILGDISGESLQAFDLQTFLIVRKDSKMRAPIELISKR
eukprot:c18414_g1_i1.p1 GENE.c18414_g1_i1~~c18414_g1_i1.p1  ORF type:complete len:261 (-),score=66.92 c18414_g1_i1:67-816(-)